MCASLARVGRLKTAEAWLDANHLYARLDNHVTQQNNSFRNE
jgi:hypothetical protein